jgi:hypothetical protein
VLEEKEKQKKKNKYLYTKQPKDHRFLMKRAMERYNKSMAMPSLKSRRTKMEWTRLDAQTRIRIQGGTLRSEEESAKGKKEKEKGCKILISIDSR